MGLTPFAPPAPLQSPSRILQRLCSLSVSWRRRSLDNFSCGASSCHHSPKRILPRGFRVDRHHFKRTENVMVDGCFPFVNATIRRIKCVSCKVKRFGYERATFVSVFEADNRCTWLALNSRLGLLNVEVTGVHCRSRFKDRFRGGGGESGLLKKYYNCFSVT